MFGTNAVLLKAPSFARKFISMFVIIIFFCLKIKRHNNDLNFFGNAKIVLFGANAILLKVPSFAKLFISLFVIMIKIKYEIFQIKKTNKIYRLTKLKKYIYIF